MSELPGKKISALNDELTAADPALVGNEALLVALLSGSDDCIKILDLDGRLQFMSEGGKRVMEVDDFPALKGCPWPDFWLDEGNVAAKAAIEACRNGKPARFLSAASTVKGNSKFWDVRVMPVLGADGRPTHILSISTDITQTRTAEMAARESQVQTKVALAAAEMGVWQCRVIDGKFVDLIGDDRAVEMLGGTAGKKASFEEFLARLAPEDRSRLAAEAAKAMDPAGDGIMDVEYRIVSGQGAPHVWIHARAQALASTGGKRLIGTVRDVSQRKDAEAREAMLGAELQHRIKNTLAMVSAIASQTLRGDDIADRRAAFSARLQALGNAHDILTAKAWSGAPMQSVVQKALSPHMAGPDRIVLDGPPVELGARQALSMALTIHELATNAAKYGALSVPGGKVLIDWSLGTADAANQGAFRFTWRETGGPPVAEPTLKGFGSRLITRVLAADFEGEVSIDYAPGGVVCTLASSLPTSSVSSLS